MGATVEELGAVVLDGLRTAGYRESTVGQYEMKRPQVLCRPHVSCGSGLSAA